MRVRSEVEMARQINPDEIMNDAHAYRQAHRLARYSRFDCIAWTRRDGQQRYARLTEATIKQAMLDGGTQQRIICYTSHNASPITAWTWKIANNVRCQLLRHMYTHG